MSSSSKLKNFERSFRDRDLSALPAPDVLEAAAFIFGVAGLLAAWRMGIRSRTDRLALRLAVEREAAFVEAARRLADAARLSIEAVREEMNRAVRAIAPGLDTVLFFEERDAQLVCLAAYGERVDFFRGARLALDDESSLLVLALRCGHRVTTLEAPRARLLHPADAFAAAIPLVVDAGRRCVLYAGGAQSGLDHSADRIVQLIDQATPAYRIALDRADDRNRAEYDGLTGLLTARAFRLRLANTLEEARFAPSGRVGLLFVDTDRFKAWNDTYGHASGDALLRELAQLLRAAAADGRDFAARNGGDEFCVVFANAHKSDAVERAGRLCEQIAAADFGRFAPPAARDVSVTISASIGVACFPADADFASALLEKADEAMYYCKRTGRDGVGYFAASGTLARTGASVVPTSLPERRRE